MRSTNQCIILLAVSGAAALAQPANTAASPAGAPKPPAITIKAREPYKQADGSPYTPSLQLRCEEANGKRSVLAILETGGVETAASNEIESFTSRSASGRKPVDTSVTNYSDERPFHDPKMKFDDGKATSASWRLNLEKDLLILPGSVFLKSALKAHTVSISFPAEGESNQPDIVSQFDLSSFQADFDKHPECSVK